MMKNWIKIPLRLNYVGIRHHKSQTSINSKWPCLINRDTEEFLLFVCNFNMDLEMSGTLKYGAKIQYLCTLVYGEVLHRFDVLSAEVEGATPVTLASIILVLGAYFFPVNALSKKRRAMRRRMRKSRGLKVRRYITCLVDINDYLDVLPGAKISDKI